MFGRLLDLVDQILRHGAGERFAAHKNNYALRVSGKVHGGLTGRVRAADHINDFTFAGERLGGATAIINSRTLQPVDTGSGEATPLDAGRDHQRVTRNLISIRQLNDSVRAFGTDADRFLRQDLDPETLRLHDGAPGKIGAAETGRKSQIVFDAGTHPRLTAGRFALNHYGVQAFGSSVNGSGETSGASTHDG